MSCVSAHSTPPPYTPPGGAVHRKIEREVVNGLNLTYNDDITGKWVW